MATPSHAAAVKSLNKSPGRRRFVYKSFSQLINEIDINVFRSLDKVKAEPSEGSSFFRDCLMEWRELNTAEDFISFYEEMLPLVQTLPLVLLHKEMIFSKLISRLEIKARLSLEPILRLIAALSRDLLKDFVSFLPRIADSLVSLLESGADREPEIVEQVFTSWSYIMMYLQKYLIRRIKSVLKETVKFRYYPKDYVREFIAEATSFLLRNAPREQLEEGIKEIISEVVEIPSFERKHGASSLLGYAMRGTSSGLHSKSKRVLQFLMSSQLLSVGDVNEVSRAAVEVVIGAFQNICDILGPKELNLIRECLYVEIKDAIAERYLLHLSRLLLLLVATLQIDNDCKFSDKGPLLELVDILVRKHLMPSDIAKEFDHSSEVIDKVLKLMLCILDGLQETNDMLTISDCSLQWEPVFQLRNSSLLIFIRELLQRGPDVVCTFRVHILSALDDLVETSQEEVTCLLLSFFEKLETSPQFNSFLNRMCDRGSRIHGFMTETICWWIKVINDIVDNVSSVSQINEAMLSLLWGIIGCYPYVFDVEANSSLLMNLIDALNSLLVTKAEINAGVPKSTWEGLIGAALSSYNKWHRGKKCGPEETEKVLHLARTCKSSLQVLLAVADYLDCVHGVTLEANNTNKKYILELGKQKTVDAVGIFADNLCHSNKAIRVATLRIMRHYEPLTCESNAMDEPPEKKLKTETGVSYVCYTDNVIKLLFSIEATPLSISTSRKVILLISRIQMSLAAGKIPETYLPLVLGGMIGVLHNRFSYLWNPATECLSVLISTHVGLVWDKFISYVEQCQSKFHPASNRLNEMNSVSANKLNGLLERFHLFISPESDSTPHMTVLSMLLQSLQKIPSVVEFHSRQIIPLFLEFLGYNRGDLTSVGSFNSNSCKGKDWKSVLKEWLNLMKLMRNPKSLYMGKFLKDVLQNRFLDENDAEIQMKVLDCLLLWKDEYLFPYDQHLRNLINSKNLREELTTWSLSRESGLIEEGHRTCLVPLVIRLLMPKVRKLKTLASRKHTSLHHRKAVLSFMAQLDVNELPLFFLLLIKPLQIIPKEADKTVDLFWMRSYLTMEEFREINFLKYFTVENIAALSRKKIFGFLHVIEDILVTFDELHVKPFISLLMGCVVRVLTSCALGLEAAKDGGSSPVHLSAPLTLNNKDNTGDLVVTGSAVKQFKDLRSLCLKIISGVLDKYEDHDFGYGFWDLFFNSVKSLIDAFKQEGSSSKKPSSLFSCFLTMSRSEGLVSLLCREMNLVPDIFSILTVPTASEAIISSVLKFIENLMNLDSELDDEDSGIKKVVLPNLEPLVSSLHCRYQNTSNRKLVRSSTETEIRIFSLLSKYIKNPLPAQKFVDVLLPLFTKGVKDSEVALKALEVVRDIIPVVGTGSTKKILSAVSPLLVSAELDMRLCICDLLDALAKADPSVLFVAKLVCELNAISSLEMGDLDYDTIVNAYERIGIDLFNTMEEDHALVILSQCVYDMSSEDIIRRHSAYSSLVSFVEFSSILLDQGKGNDINEETQTADEGCWTRASIQRMINKFLLKHMGEAMTSGSQIKKEWTDLLREMILKLPQLSNFSSFKDLCSGDAEVDFFNNIIHLQRHRKARALLRFKKVIVSSNVSGGLINKVFVPLFVNMLFDVQDENVRSACVEALASISAYLEWKPYSGLLIRCVREMEKNPQKQKVLLRLFCAILDQFHFFQISSAEEAKDSFAIVSGAETNIARSLGTEIQTFLHGTVLPKIQKVLNSDSDKVNVDVSRAILKLLKLLPGDIMDSQLSSVIHRLSNFLKSRADSMRNSARLALADCLRELGLEYLQFIVGVLRAILKRGYELHVLGYTLNFILSKCLSNPISGKLDYCLGDLLSVVEDDVLGDVAEQKEVEKIASKMIETKKNKSFETLELVARNITFRTHAMKLLSVVTKHLQKHLTPKVKSRLESMLNHIAAGIECNPSVDQTDLFVFLYGLIEDRIKEENCLLASTSNTEAKKMTNDMKEKTSSSGRVIVSKSGGSHLITVFAIGLLHKRLKNVKPKALDGKQLSMLDSFLKLLGDCLSSKYEDVLSVTLRCLIPLINLPLPSLHSQADKIKTTLLAIAQSSVNSSSPLMQSCLSLLTKLLRSTKVTLSADQLHMLIQFPLFVDLERNPSDVALSLLKAIVSRKLVVHEIYDIVIQVAELMVTSQVESIRKKCSQILLQFLLDYHLSDKRLQQHLDLLLANLRYEHSSGREAVLEMLHAIIKKFPQSKLNEQSDTLFVRLVICLANDCNNKVRTMTATTIKLLIGRISPHLLQSILEYSRSWYLGKKQQLCSAGAQVLGLLVEVMKKDFRRHIGSILPVTRSILHSAVADRQPDTPDEATARSWKESYYSLVLLEKIICQFPDLILARDLEDIWEAACELLLHPRTWLRNRSNRLIALYFRAVTEAGREHHETFFLMKPSRLFLISSSLCCQLEGQSTFDDAVCNRIIQNLVSVICNLHSSKEKMDIVNQHNLLSADGQHEQGLLLKAFQMLDSRKGKGAFLSIVSDGHDISDQHVSHDFQYLLVSNLLKKMGKIALQKEPVQMKIIFNSFRLISSEISQDYCERYAIQMLPSLYKVCEGFAGKDISDDLKQLAQEVCDSIKNRIGSQKFIHIYNDIRKNLKAKRDKRKQEEKLMAVINPMRNAKRKLKIAAKHRANKKRKMMTMKMARWMR